MKNIVIQAVIIGVFLALIVAAYSQIAYKTCVVEQATTYWCR